MNPLEIIYQLFGGNVDAINGLKQTQPEQESPYDALKRREKEFSLKQKMLQPYQMVPPPLIDPNYPPVR